MMESEKVFKVSGEQSQSVSTNPSECCAATDSGKVKPELTLNSYQRQAMETCMPSCDNFAYMFLNLVGEAGEFASKVAKAIRKEKAMMDHNELISVSEYAVMTEQEILDLKAEVGDIAWQLAGLCYVLGWSFEDVCRQNLEKLASRKLRHVIDGDGDNR